MASATIYACSPSPNFLQMHCHQTEFGRDNFAIPERGGEMSGILLQVELSWHGLWPVWHTAPAKQGPSEQPTPAEVLIAD